MRVRIPEEIAMLADKIQPYMEFDNEAHECRLKSGAPEEIVEAQKKFHKWMQENTRRNFDRVGS